MLLILYTHVLTWQETVFFFSEPVHAAGNDMYIAAPQWDIHWQGTPSAGSKTVSVAASRFSSSCSLPGAMVAQIVLLVEVEGACVAIYASLFCLHHIGHHIALHFAFCPSHCMRSTLSIWYTFSPLLIPSLFLHSVTRHYFYLFIYSHSWTRSTYIQTRSTLDWKV